MSSKRIVDYPVTLFQYSLKTSAKIGLFSPFHKMYFKASKFSVLNEDSQPGSCTETQDCSTVSSRYNIYYI